VSGESVSVSMSVSWNAASSGLFLPVEYRIRPVSRSVCPAGKTVDSIEMPFVMAGRVGQRNHAAQIPQGKGQILGDRMAQTAQCSVWGKCGIGHVKTAEPIELPFATVSVVDQKSCIRWACTLAPPDKYG